jgi:putative phage-type endonuclease
MSNVLEHLNFLKSLINHPQKSPEWFEQRKNKLTSSDAATALGINPYKNQVQLLLEKCGAGRSFEGNESTLHGQKYEDEAIQKYEVLMSRNNHTFGMISFSDLDEIRSKKESSKKYIDTKYHFLGGSPDGVAIDKNINDDSVLTQLEVKCPLRRKIKHAQIPEYYFPQVQLNMFILDLEVTDFIEYIPNIPGKNVELNIVRIYRDDEWFDEKFPILRKFWDDVEYWRKQDITTHPDYKKYYTIKEEVAFEEPKYLFIDDDEKPPNYVDKDICLFND